LEVFSILLSLFFIAIAAVAIYGNWIFIDEDGYSIDLKKRPNLLVFWWFLLRYPVSMLKGTKLQQYARQMEAKQA
jgi:hypothetical protein